MKNSKAKIIGYYHYGVILTYLSVFSAIIGICFSVSQHPGYGVICLLISGVCDAFDGTVAKTRKNRTDEENMFGEQIDSLSDLIAFGVAPAMIGYGLGMRSWYFIALFCVFILCALIRLAYFNVTEEIKSKQGNTSPRVSYEGLPVTNVAVAIPVFFLIATMFSSPIYIWSIMSLGYILLSALFVIRFRMPKLKVKGLIITMIILTIILVSLMLVKRFLL